MCTDLACRARRGRGPAGREAEPVPRAVRASAGVAADDRRRAAARAPAAGDRAAAAPGGRPVRCGCCAASPPASTRPRSTTTAHTAATRRSSAARRARARGRVAAQCPRRGSSAAAAPRSRPARSGTPSRASRRSRTTSCATRTSRSRGRSRTASLMEDDPFALVEAMTIAAYATGCDAGFVYIRGGVSARARARPERDRPGARGGGSSADLELELRIGAGAYVCGEETALFQSIEGYRGEPRNKPPFPVEVGLFGKPTVVNNVETLVNVPAILLGRRRAETRALLRLGQRRAAGAVRARVRDAAARAPRPRGAPDEPKAVLLGGAAGSFLRPDQLDLPLTFEGAREAGRHARFGRRARVRRDADLAAAVLRIAEFFRDESCGQCVPCRVGTVRQEEALHRLASGKTLGNEVETLADLAQVMRDASICGLGQTAASAVQSAMIRSSRCSHDESSPSTARSSSVADGATILDACKRRGIETPTLCYGDTLHPVNVCRVCVVEVEGSRTLVPSCSRKAEAGMAVHTDSERVRTSRRLVLELLGLVRRPVARRRTRSATSADYGAEPERFGPDAATVAQAVKVDNDLYVRDYSKCILCYQLRRGVRRGPPEHVRDRRRRTRLRRAHLDGARRPAARLGVRLLRQLHRRLPDGRAHVQERVRPAAGGAVGRVAPDRGATRSARTAASAATSSCTCRTARS